MPIVAVPVADWFLPPDIHLAHLLVIPLALAAAFTDTRRTAVTALLALVALVVAGAERQTLTTENVLVQTLSLVLFSALLLIATRLREQHQRQLAIVRQVSEAAQSVLLRPLPRRTGAVSLASTYVAAENRLARRPACEQAGRGDHPGPHPRRDPPLPHPPSRGRRQPSAGRTRRRPRGHGRPMPTGLPAHGPQAETTGRPPTQPELLRAQPRPVTAPPTAGSQVVPLRFLRTAASDKAPRFEKGSDSMTYRNDMTMMLAMHAALRRELVRISRVVERPSDDPRRILQAAAGWQMFTSYLHVHHGAEDDVLWPAMRLSLAGKEDDLAFLAAMEAEHARIDPLLEAIDAAVANAEGSLDRIAELLADLSSSLLSHIDHEEREGLPLIDATVTADAWQAFMAEHGKRIGADTNRFFPWIVDSAQPDTIAAVLSRLPATVQQTFHDDWEPAYNRLVIWPKTALTETAGETS
ncbi:hemerythrin domain-containing protein [Streptomyces sp. MI02-2A]|nr:MULTISPECIES: hemerythrin domain-containing protein [unclassified Streptomyces]MDX3265862.1 hemerythrin domain-containing protein [Streptomyces sp. MI02-2A]